MRFTDLPDELCLAVFAHVDIPELLAISRTNRHLRELAHDPILHAQRLRRASYRLSLTLPQRPSLSSLLPPQSTIYLSTTHALARKLSRQLVSIKLNRNLSRRPSATSLVKCNILPEECCGCDRITGEIVWGQGVAPGLVERKRKIERERVRDCLRRWVEGKAVQVQRVKDEEGRNNESLGVRRLVKKFAISGGGKGAGTPTSSSASSSSLSPGRRWGKREERDRCDPTRAHVLGLRRFWEGFARQQAIQA